MEIKGIYYKDVLRNINMKFEPSNIYGIVGKGKTVLFELISNGLLYEKGDIIDFKNIGYFRQNVDEMFYNDTVYDEIKCRVKSNNFDKKIKDSLKLIDLDISLLYRNPNTLSSVEKRKLGLCCVLVSNPEVLLFDEPIVGFNQKEVVNFVNLIRKLKNRYKKTIIISTNDTDFLHKIVDYVYVLYEGKVVLDGSKFEVFKGIKKYRINVPNEIEFSNMVFERKNIKLGYRDDINDLIKDIYRFVK